MAAELDKAIFLGTGANGQPLGLIPGVTTYGITSTDAAGQATWAAIRAAVVRFMTANAASGPGGVNALVRPELWDFLDGVEDILTRHAMAVAARSLALRGECVFLIDNGLIPAVDWELSTRNGRPRAYRLSLPEAGGNTTTMALAGEVLHFRIAPDPAAPWNGQAPLRRSSLTAGLLQILEVALAETYENMPLGSQIVPMPESAETDLETLGRDFRGKRGRVLLRESVNVSAAGGPAPAQDWRPQDVSPDLQKTMSTQMLEASQNSILNAFGVLPALFSPAAQGPLVREAQRHLAQWTLQPIAMLMAEETADKIGSAVMIDTMRPLQAYDSGNRARSFVAIIEGLAKAQEAGLDAQAVNAALSFVNLGENDGAA